MMSWRRGQAYAQHLRDRVLVASGTLGEVAERWGVSKAYVSRVRSRQERLGQSSPGAQCNHVPPRLQAVHESLLAQVALAPEQTRAQLCQWVRAEHGIEVGVTTMGKAVRRAGLMRKKDCARRRARTRRCRAGPPGLGGRASFASKRAADFPG